MSVRKAGQDTPSLSEITAQAPPLYFCIVKPTARQDVQRDGFVHVQLFESIFCSLLSGKKAGHNWSKADQLHPAAAALYIFYQQGIKVLYFILLFSAWIF